MPGVPTGSLLGTVNGNRPTGEFEPALHVAPLAVAFTISLKRHTLWPIRSNIEMDVLRTCVGVVALLSKSYSGRKNGARTVQRGPTRSQVFNIDMPSFHAVHAGRPVIRVIYRFAHL